MVNAGNPNPPFYIFDLDGTLALIEHRRHLVQKPEGPDAKGFKPDWPAFYKACVEDAPNWPVIATFLQLYSVGCNIEIWSGREDSVRGETLQWLYMVTRIQIHVLDRMLKMRPTGDFTPDEQMKRKWLNSLNTNRRALLTAVFDDRNKVVDMWRKEGVACFQVAPGEF